MFTVKDTITMLPDLAQLNIADCLQEPFRQKRMQYLATKLRGRDAVFWKAQDQHSGDDYDFGKNDINEIIEDKQNGLESFEDEDNAEAHRTISKSGVEAKELPEYARLFHWSDHLPRVKPGDRIYTKGYTWTSTSNRFTWNRNQRCVIFCDKGTMGWIDPSSHSKAFACDDDDNFTHVDVVLGPGKYVVLEDSDYKRITGSDLYEDNRRVAVHALNMWFDDHERYSEKGDFTELRSAKKNEDPDEWRLTWEPGKELVAENWKVVLETDGVPRLSFLKNIVEVSGSMLIVKLSKLQSIGPVLKRLSSSS